jgi:hypothetical protein
VTPARFAALLLIGLLAAAVGPLRPAAAQSLRTQPERYLLGIDAMDARALWTQPAGLSGRREASVNGMATLATDDVAVQEYGITVASGGLGLGWQHDQHAGDQWAVGFALGNPRIGLGGTQRWVTGGGDKATVTDLGFRYQPSAYLRLSLAWQNLGSPAVRGVVEPERLRPAAALLLWGGRLRVAGEWTVTTDEWSAAGVRVGAGLALPWGLSLAVRGDFDGSLSGEGFALALTWNGTSGRVAGFYADPRSGGSSTGIWGGAVRDLSAPIRRR